MKSNCALCCEASPSPTSSNGRIFDPARLEIEIKDRFGNPITPHEWFLVPVFVIDQAVERIKDGTITNYRYDPKTASLIRAAK